MTKKLIFTFLLSVSSIYVWAQDHEQHTQKTTALQHYNALYGPWAVITGASDGIGKAFADELAKQGLNLVLIARREEPLNIIAKELFDVCGIATLVIAADLTTREGNQKVIDQTAPYDVGLLVAAAGFGTSGLYLDNNSNDELGMIDINCRSSAELCHAFGNRFKARKHSGIILMSSIVAFQGVPRSANYAATKAYIQSLAEGLNVELSPYGVDVIASAPGPVDSGFAERANMSISNAQKPEVVAKQTLAALGNKTTVRPGFLSKLLGYSLAILPRWARVKVMTKMMKGMTKVGKREVSR
jgi:uncharacterized protein